MSDLKILLDQVDEASKKEAKAIVSALKGAAYNSDLFEKHKAKVISCLEDSVTLSVKAGGLYIFTMIDVVDVDVKNFNDVNKSTKLKREKGADSIRFEIGDTLYVGKNEDDLQDRINQHINLCEDSTTYSLKLSSKKREFLLENKLMVSCFTIKTEYEKYKKILLPVIERYLHNELSPLVGSAKTS